MNMTDGLSEWECCIKDSEQGAAEGAGFIRDHMINMTERHLMISPE
jgi:hypothetical protein